MRRRAQELSTSLLARIEAELFDAH